MFQITKKNNHLIHLKVLVRYVDNDANTQWSRLLGSGASGTFNVGFSVIEVHFKSSH